jgi:hypothetical protein
MNFFAFVTSTLSWTHRSIAFLFNQHDGGPLCNVSIP